jgi:hypothetical protein
MLALGGLRPAFLEDDHTTDHGNRQKGLNDRFHYAE